MLQSLAPVIDRLAEEHVAIDDVDRALEEDELVEPLSRLGFFPGQVGDPV